MNSALISQTLLELLHEASVELASVDLFLFGSILNHTGHINDVDLLVVYETTDDLPQVKNVLDGIDRKIPLDIIYMRQEEEREFDFVKGQGAQRIDAEGYDALASCGAWS